MEIRASSNKCAHFGYIVLIDISFKTKTAHMSFCVCRRLFLSGRKVSEMVSKVFVNDAGVTTYFALMSQYG